MAAGSFLDGQGSGVALSVNGDVVQEVIVGLLEVLTGKRPSGFLSDESTLNRSQNHADGRLGSQNFQEIGVGNQ